MASVAIQHPDGRVAVTWGCMVVNASTADNRCRLLEYPTHADYVADSGASYIWLDAPTLSVGDERDDAAQAEAIVANENGDYYGATIL